MTTSQPLDRLPTTGPTSTSAATTGYRNGPTADGRAAGELPLTPLRGGAVDVNRRLVLQVLGGLCVVGLAAVVAVLFVAGAHKNDQITRLHRQGVPVAITISGCLGQLGGSGSNQAGYSCRGTFSLQGRRYHEPIPGSTLYTQGTTLRGVAVPGDPALVTPAAVLRTEQASFSVFALPIVLAALWVILVAAGVVLTLRHRRLRA